MEKIGIIQSNQTNELFINSMLVMLSKRFVVHLKGFSGSPIEFISAIASTSLSNPGSWGSFDFQPPPFFLIPDKVPERPCEISFLPI